MKRTITLLSLIIAATQAQAQFGFSTRVVKDSLFVPWELIYGPDDHIWFTQRNGYICRLNPQSGLTDTLLHETNTVNLGGEGGLLGMQLHPQFPLQPYVYAAYDYLADSNYTARVVRYTYANGVLQMPLILLDHVNANFNHNGCRLLIVGDNMFVSFGDAQSPTDPQDVSKPNGKILRINLDGSIPADNPIPGNPVWTWGHRNVQGLVYANNILYSSEHGANTDDEFNIIRSGHNYGWPNVEGFCDQPAELAFCADSNIVQPLMAWTPTIAPSGIDYYTQPMFPQLQDHILIATLKDQHLYYLTLSASHDSVVAANTLDFHYGRLRDFCISPAGKIYVSTSNSTVPNGAPVDRIIEISDSIAVTNSTAATVFHAYPNPAQDYIAAEWEGAAPTAAYRLCDAAGRVAKAGLLTKLTIISLATMPAGVYLLQADDGKGNTALQKIIRQ